MATISDMTVTSLSTLQAVCWQNSEDKGFHDSEPTDPAGLAIYNGNRLMLIVSEAAEALEEIRKGIPAGETYYPTRIGTDGWHKGQQMVAWCETCRWGLSINQVGPSIRSGARTPKQMAEDHQETLGREVHDVRWAELHKPEGVPSELADIVIRCFDFAGSNGFNLGQIIQEKLTYNSSREHMHGKKF